ncbi:hypothetical protein GPA10_01920 [Streptomyces sp. p1417]|uniref:Uncharacterized protein n=1 Tax=Streptomyces typhae TaxID=2681492 RepID=A0A6L6WPE5_9ACTN|nr:hypothetical protein [Streptomyces typhae]
MSERPGRDLRPDRARPPVEAHCRSTLYSLHGFSPDLVDLADRRDDLLLVDLPTLYGS